MPTSQVAAGDVLTAKYRLRSAVSLLYDITDTFDRVDSVATINPASDGGTWTLSTGTTNSIWGISNNQGYNVVQGSTSAGGAPYIVRDLASNTAYVQMSWQRTTFGIGSVFVWLAWDPVTKSGYAFSGSGAGAWGIQRYDNGTTATTLASAALTLALNTSYPIVVSYSAAGLLSSTFNGTTLSATDTTYLGATGRTWVGIGANRSEDLFNDFRARKL